MTYYALAGLIVILNVISFLYVVKNKKDISNAILEIGVMTIVLMGVALAVHYWFGCIIITFCIGVLLDNEVKLKWE